MRNNSYDRRRFKCYRFQFIVQSKLLSFVCFSLSKIPILSSAHLLKRNDDLCCGNRTKRKWYTMSSESSGGQAPSQALRATFILLIPFYLIATFGSPWKFIFVNICTKNHLQSDANPSRPLAIFPFEIHVVNVERKSASATQINLRAIFTLATKLRRKRFISILFDASAVWCQRKTAIKIQETHIINTYTWPLRKKCEISDAL